MLKGREGLRRAGNAAVFLVYAFAIGLVVALGVRAALLAVSVAGHALWDVLPAALGFAWLPLVICPLGGAAIGWWGVHKGGTPTSLETVIASIRETGAYRTESVPAGIVGFALPLVFGGCVGPEAGLAGVIASVCAWVGDRLKAAGHRARAVSDVTVAAVFAAVFGAPFAGVVAGDAADRHAAGEVSARRSEKLVAYAAAAGGAFVGLLLFGLVAGGTAGLPRLDRMAVDVADLPWGLMCLATAWLLALVYTGAHAGFARLSRRIGEHPIAKPFACGAAIGIFGVCLPLALFSGEEQIDFITASWQVVPAAVLVAAALAKAVLTPLCLEFGWRGGHFFPCIFMGVALGYGIAALTGADPVFCAAVTTAAFLACTMQRPLLAVALLLLCIPPQGLVWMVLAAFVGAKLPLPAWDAK